MAPREVPSLESLCFERICEDIGRHAAKWKPESDKEVSIYMALRMMYSEELIRCLPASPSVENFLRGGINVEKYVDTLDFIFNPYMKKIYIVEPLNPLITAAITKNCKDLTQLAIFKSTFPDLLVNFLKSMKNITFLRLDDCSSLSAPKMTAIADSLEHLKILALRNIKNDVLFALSGHEFPFCDSIIDCSFVKNCNVNCKMKLVSLDIDTSSISDISSEAVACLLTHIPTLKTLNCGSTVNYRHRLPELIIRINEQRKILNFPILQFQLERVDYEYIGDPIHDSRALNACVEACPKLKILRLNFWDNVISCNIIEENELNFLEVVYINCVSFYQMFSKCFQQFWIKTGSRLKELHISPPLFDPVIILRGDVIQRILAFCPNLRILELRNLELIERFPGHFPKLPVLEKLTIVVFGENSLAEIFAFHLILAADNIDRKDVTLVINGIVAAYEFI